MHTQQGKEAAHEGQNENTRGLAVGADQKTDSRDDEVSSVGVIGAEGHTTPLCEGCVTDCVECLEEGGGVPLWSVWGRKGGQMEIVTGFGDDGRIHVTGEHGQTGGYDSAEALRSWRERVETDGERARGVEESREVGRLLALAQSRGRENEELAADLRAKCAEVEGLRLALEGAPVCVEVAPWMVGGGFSARWREGARLIIGTRRATEAEAWWDASIVAGELARGRVPSVAEVDALVVGLAALGDDWRDAVAKRVRPVSGEAETGRVSKSGETSDRESVSEDARAVYRALSDARDAHAADSWAQLAEDAPGLVMVAELGAWFCVALEGEAEGRALDSEADRVAVGLVLARAWLARSDASEVRELGAKAGMTWEDCARVVACARTLSGLGGES